MSHSFKDRFAEAPKVHVSPRLPSWLTIRLPSGNGVQKTEACLLQHRVTTVCQEASCPNLLECYSQKTATFLLLGKACTRACAFCQIEHQKTLPPPDFGEIDRVVESVVALNLRYVVLTMVTRDDLADGGAEHVARAVLALKELSGVSVEVLTSDFGGNQESLRSIAQSRPYVFNHNIETVRRLTSRVRHKATYERSLEVLSFMKQQDPSLMTKSGLMVGLGETHDEVYEALGDLRAVGVSLVTIGQYLQPSKKKLPVHSFIHPNQFQVYRDFGLALGFRQVFSGPQVRSSYHAHEAAHS